MEPDAHQQPDPERPWVGSNDDWVAIPGAPADSMLEKIRTSSSEELRAAQSIGRQAELLARWRAGERPPDKYDPDSHATVVRRFAEEMVDGARSKRWLTTLLMRLLAGAITCGVAIGWHQIAPSIIPDLFLIVVVFWLVGISVIVPCVACARYASAMSKLMATGRWEELLMTQHTGREWADAIISVSRHRAEYWGKVAFATLFVVFFVQSIHVGFAFIVAFIVVLWYLIPMMMFHQSVCERIMTRMEKDAMSNGWKRAGPILVVSIIGHALESLLLILILVVPIWLVSSEAGGLMIMVAPLLVEFVFLVHASAICRTLRAEMGDNLNYPYNSDER